MSRRKVRLFFCLLFVAIVVVHKSHRSPVLVAAAPLVLDQAAPPRLRSYIVAGAPMIKRWPSATDVFYRAGRPYPTALPKPYVDPAFELEMLRLRPTLLASAERHNRQAVTGLRDDEFAVLLAAQLYFEYNSTLATRSKLGRVVTPVYQEAQGVANAIGMGNFSVWPANLRPSVAASLLRAEMPYINALDRPAIRRIPLKIHGSRLQPLLAERGPNWQPSDSAVAAEIDQPNLAVEYLAANFEVASYRAQFDWAPISWMTFAAWHNQGVVSPAHIASNGQLAQVLATIETYIPAAMHLVNVPSPPAFTGVPLEQ
ncbi:MAG: hypothetical protein H0T53_16055 [Herpetosiphonaceae bacterium]|nr:hypothetical protein [Herpetosiphonaceae bacterium]